MLSDSISVRAGNLLQMPTQYMMAILFCTCDGILNFQNVYCTYWSTPRKLKAQQQQVQQQDWQITVAEANELDVMLATAPNDDLAKSKSLAAPLEGSSSSGSSSSSSGSAASPLRPSPACSPESRAIPAAPKLRSISAGMNCSCLAAYWQPCQLAHIAALPKCT